MNWSVVAIGISAVYSAFLIKNLVRLAINCKREGVKAVKFSMNLWVILVSVVTIWCCWSTINSFNKAHETREVAAFAEARIGTEDAENFAREQEQKYGIKILDHEKYYLENIESIKSLSEKYSFDAVKFLIFAINGTLVIISDFLIITGVGLHSTYIKEPIPIIADYDSQIGKIFVKDRNPNGKLEKVLMFNASPKNLASLGQFIVSEEQTTQEVTQ